MTETPDAVPGDTPTPLHDLPTVRAAELAGWRRPPTVDTYRRAPVPDGRSEILDEAEMRYLQAVAASPAQPSSVYPRTARVSPRRALVIRERLTRDGYLIAHRVNRAGKGRDALVLEVTDRGRVLLRHTSRSSGGQL